MIWIRIPFILCLLSALFTFAQSSLASTLPDTIQRVKQSVVGIGTYNPSRRPPARLLGTGFVVGGNRIITNYHVIDVDLNQEQREQLVAFVGQGAKPEMQRIAILKKDLQHDLAVLSIKRAIPALVLADNGNVREGELYAFTGFPIGAILGLYPVTHQGMISSLTPMAIPAPSSKQLSALKINRLRNPTMVYQLDATAYPGNSGSPLYHPETGEVVGVLNMVHVKKTKEDVLSDPSGISYAIPVKYLNTLLLELDRTK